MRRNFLVDSPAKMLRSIAITMLAALLWNLPAYSQSYKDLNSEAIQAMRAGELARSEELFQKALAEYPSGSQDAYDQVIKSNMAILYRKMGKQEMASKMEAGSAGSATLPNSQPQETASGNADLKEYVDFARSQVNRVVYMKTKQPRVITVEACKSMKRPDGKAMVKVFGYHGDKNVVVDIVLARGADGQLAVSESNCEMYYRCAAPEITSTPAAAASSGSILGGSGGGAFSAGGMGGCGGSGGGGCVYSGAGGAYGAF